MHKMRSCFPGLPERSKPEANIEAGQWHGSDVVHFGIELWGGGNSIEQPWNGDWKNECVSSRTGNRQASARDEQRKVAEWIQDKSSWGGCDQCAL